MGVYKVAPSRSSANYWDEAIPPNLAFISIGYGRITLFAGTEAKVGLLTSKGMSGLIKLSVLPNEGTLFCSSKISSESDELFDSFCIGMLIYSPF